MDLPTELIVGAIGLLTAAGGGLSVATGKLWAWVNERIKDCENDRTVLHKHIDGMNTELKTLSRTVGRMEGTLEEVTARNKRIDHDEEDEQ